jgi:hypothetical protein
MMKNTTINRKQHSFAFRLTLGVRLTFFLVTLVLGALGQGNRAVTLDVLVIFFSLFVLTVHKVIRPSSEVSDLGMTIYGFFFLPLYNRVDPLRWRAEHERIEPQEEDFKPYVFKEPPEDGRHEEMSSPRLLCKGAQQEDIEAKLSQPDVQGFLGSYRPSM